MKYLKPGLFLLVLLSGLGLGFSSCDKEKGPDGELPLVFESLTAENDTISPGGTTKVTARATGNSLTYFWSVSAGTILGSGAQITYTTDPCEPGDHTITCTVKDGQGTSDTKSVNVFVEFE
ncbi:MAG: PKD domain-containing protein [Bacteroidales bacterium]